MLLILILGLFLLAFALCGLILVRNEAVYNYTNEMLRDIDRAADQDIAARRDPQWRRDAYDAVSYYEMLLKFWRRLDSFYPDQRFRQPR